MLWKLIIFPMKYDQTNLSLYINGCMYVRTVCMFQHNSGAPGATSTKLGAHIT